MENKQTKKETLLVFASTLARSCKWRNKRREAVRMSHYLHISTLCYVQEEGTDWTRRSVNGYSSAVNWQDANSPRQNYNTQCCITSLLVILCPRGRTGEWTSSFGTAQKNRSYLSVRQLWHICNYFFVLTAALVKSLAISSTTQLWLQVSWVNFWI